MKINTLYNDKRTYASNREISFIVVHYTAGTTSKVGMARNTASYFKTSNVEASTDYIIDDEEVYLCNPDIRNYYTWAVGGGKYGSMSTSEGGKFYGKCTNKNSISIEICSNKTNKKSLLASDKDWYFTESALKLAAELTRDLMKQYNIPIERVIMHHHVTGKVCPNPFCLNEEALEKWQEFKDMVVGIKKEETEVITEMNMRVNGKDIKINRILKDEKNYIEVAGLKNAGFDVGYNQNTKIVMLANKVKELSLTVDGEEKSIEAVNINGSNFVSIRSLAAATGKFDVKYENGEIIVNTK